LRAVIFDQLAGIKTTHVPYKGGAQGLADLLSGQVQFAFSTIGSLRRTSTLVACVSSLSDRRRRYYAHGRRCQRLPKAGERI
jgi:hypothetical protein